MRRLESHIWWPELVALKDEKSLRELGEQFGATPGAIMKAFKRNEITRTSARSGPRATLPPEAGSTLPPEPGEQVEVPTKGALSAFDKLLGTVPDLVIAKKAGVSLRKVANHRAALGVAGFEAPREPRPRGRRSKIDAYADVAGTVKDAVISDNAGVSLNTVRASRRVRGLPSARAVHKSAMASTATPLAAPESAESPPVAPPPKAAPKPALKALFMATPTSVQKTVVGRQWAWRVSLTDGGFGVVFGATLLDAAQRALGAGEVVGMSRIGVVL